MLWGMNKCSGCRSVFLTLTLLLSVCVANAQENQSVALTEISASDFFIHYRSRRYEVRLVIRNTSSIPLTLRKCGIDPSPLRICTYDIHAEHLSAGRWIKTKPPEPLGDTGIKATELINPGTQNAQIFPFDPARWGVSKGEKVRIVFALFNPEGRKLAATYVTPSFVIK